MIIDRRLTVAAKVMLLAGVMTLFGVIHSPLPGNQLFVPIGPQAGERSVLGSEHRWHVLEFAAGYFSSALLAVWWSRCSSESVRQSWTEHEHEMSGSLMAIVDHSDSTRFVVSQRRVAQTCRCSQQAFASSIVDRPSRGRSIRYSGADDGKRGWLRSRDSNQAKTLGPQLL